MRTHDLHSVLILILAPALHNHVQWANGVWLATAIILPQFASPVISMSQFMRAALRNVSVVSVPSRQETFSQALGVRQLGQLFYGNGPTLFTPSQSRPAFRGQGSFSMPPDGHGSLNTGNIR